MLHIGSIAFLRPLVLGDFCSLSSDSGKVSHSLQEPASANFEVRVFEPQLFLVSSILSFFTATRKLSIKFDRSSIIRNLFGIDREVLIRIFIYLHKFDEM